MNHVRTNVDRSRSPIIIPFAILGVLSLLALCAVAVALKHSGSSTAGNSGDAVPVVSDLGPTSFVDGGPFGVGVTSLSLPETGAPVEVWYPASPDSYHGEDATYNVKDYLPVALQKLFPHFKGVTHSLGGIADVEAATGRFPLVVFSHGFAGFNTQSSFLTSHLASWGFVVAAPEHTDRDLTGVLNGFLKGTSSKKQQTHDVADLEQTIGLMGQLNSTQSSTFYNHLDMSRVGAVGHSAGGSAVERLAVADHQVKVFVGLAGASSGAFGQDEQYGNQAPNVPGLLESGTRDTIVPTRSMVSAYNDLNSPKRLITIQGAGHLVFTDICELDPGQGGLIGVAAKIGLTVPTSLKALGSDGCLAPDLEVTEAWPLINQSVTAELRWALGFDSSQAGLEGLSQVFPHIVGINTTQSTVSLSAAG